VRASFWICYNTFGQFLLLVGPGHYLMRLLVVLFLLRSLLLFLVAFQHHLSDAGNRARCLKRGGDKKFLYLDAVGPEERYQLEAADASTAEKILDARWAMMVLAEALSQLRQEYAKKGKRPNSKRSRFS
jgi:hypothetical protein